MQQNARLELTVKAVFIGLILAIIFCGANVYLGLKIGNTISASIPASIMAMGFLRLFKNYSIYENTVSQTIATTGEGAASTVIFIFPAMLILGQWHSFDYLSIVFVGITGGFIGIIYSIILRNVLIKDKNLIFPEGQATAQVLLTVNDKSGSSKKSGKILGLGMLISSVLSILQIGLKVLADGYYKIVQVGSSSIVGLGTSFSAAIIGAGFLVGFGPMFVSFISLLFAWLILLPIFTNIHGINDPASIVDSAFYTWQHYIRPIGVGVMIFSGLSTIFLLIKPIWHGLKDSLDAIKNIKNSNNNNRDLNIKKLMILLLLCALPVMIYIYVELIKITNFTMAFNLVLAIIITAIIMFIGFVTAAASGYFAGLVGSTNSPVSGLLYISVVSIALLLTMLLDYQTLTSSQTLLTTLVMLVAFTGFTAIITNSNIQDYKSGELVGSTPYKLQIALFIGLTVSVLIVPLFMNMIFNAYGIAGVVPHAGINPQTTLSAPQAAAVALLATNIIHQNQDWNLIVYGLIIGAVVLTIDLIGKKTRKFRCNPLSFGIGLYLPPDLVSALFIGGLLRLFVDLKQNKIGKTEGLLVKSNLHTRSNLLVCGLVAGESLMGLILSIPFVIAQSSEALRIVGNSFLPTSQVLGVVTTIALLFYVYKTSTNPKKVQN